MEETAIAHLAYSLASLNEDEASKRLQRAMSGASDELKKSALDELLFFQETKKQKRNEYIAASKKENELRRITLELDDKKEKIMDKCAIVVFFFNLCRNYLCAGLFHLLRTQAHQHNDAPTRTHGAICRQPSLPRLKQTNPETMSIIIPSAAPRNSTTAEVPDILSANLRYECNCTYYWLFVGNVCLTAAQAKISSVRKHTRRLQELIEESEDAQETILDAPYTGIVDDLVTQLLKVPEIVERIGMFNWVFRDVATRNCGEHIAPTLAAALVAYNFGRVFFEERIPLVRKQHREKEMQKILFDLIETLSGKPFKFWDNPAVRPAAEGIITFAENYKQ